MLLTLGVSHKTAPIEVREKLAFSPARIPHALKLVAQAAGLQEVALLSTCNRTEFYFSTPEAQLAPFEQVCHWWQQYLAPAFDLKPYLYALSDHSTVQHVMRLASGLESMVIGEPQILGQLKTAFRLAHQEGMVGKRLSRLFQSSFSVAKKVRHTTGINQHPVSMAFAAVALARQIFSHLADSTVVLLGAGENIELTLQHLLSKDVKHCYVVNRTLSHAQQLAQRYAVKALPLTELTQALKQADIVISSVDCVEPLITPKEMEEVFATTKRRPIFMVDLGVPRNIDAKLAAHEDIYLYTVDDLEGIIKENLKYRQIAATQGQEMIAQACQAYMKWMYSQQKTQTVRALRYQAEKIKNAALQNALRQLQKGRQPQEVLHHLAHCLTQKILHHPTIELRKASLDDAQEKIKVAKELFNIE